MYASTQSCGDLGVSAFGVLLILVAMGLMLGLAKQMMYGKVSLRDVLGHSTQLHTDSESKDSQEPMELEEKARGARRGLACQEKDVLAVWGYLLEGYKATHDHTWHGDLGG